MSYDLYVAERFWDFLGGFNTYIEILEIFDEIGIEYKTKIQEKIASVAKTKLTFTKEDMQVPSVREKNEAQQYIENFTEKKEDKP